MLNYKKHLAAILTALLIFAARTPLLHMASRNQSAPETTDEIVAETVSATEAGARLGGPDDPSVSAGVQAAQDQQSAETSDQASRSETDPAAEQESQIAAKSDTQSQAKTQATTEAKSTTKPASTSSNTQASPAAKSTSQQSTTTVSRSGGHRLTVTATAYTANEGGALTYIGTHVTAWHTIAVDPTVIPLHSWVYIPYFENKPNKGWFYAEDEGSGVKGNHVDIYFEDVSAALDFGMRDLEIYVSSTGPN